MIWWMLSRPERIRAGRVKSGQAIEIALRQTADHYATIEASIMDAITSAAKAFFDACETGGGWGACKRYCVPDAKFSAQADALSGTTTLREYTEWMKKLLVFIPNGSYELRSFATDYERRNVIVYAVFHGTHTGEGGPCPPTNKSISTDYVYVMQFVDDKIVHMTKVWNDIISRRNLGWT